MKLKPPKMGTDDIEEMEKKKLFFKMSVFVFFSKTNESKILDAINSS